MDTIYALSSGALPAGVAVVRVSGPLSKGVLRSMAGDLPPPGRLTLRVIRDASESSALDRGLVVWNPGPKSFTGEDICEFQVHGSRAVMRGLIDSFQKQGLRQAQPGEFIRRAFNNGKLDLSEVEGVADLISAETEAQRRQALGHSSGVLRQAGENWRDRLISLRAKVEAHLDFADEADVGLELGPQFSVELKGLLDELRAAVRGSAAGEVVREGFRVAIVGRPNAGKSSLLNALARREVAIVTDEPGTTRDVLEVQLDLDGSAVRVFDTAGLREATSLAEQEGVRRAQAAMQSANLVLWLVDCSDPVEDPVPETRGLASGPTLRVVTKADLATDLPSGLAISSKTGQGIPELLKFIGSAASDCVGTEPSLLVRARHREAVVDALSSLQAIEGAPLEVVAHLLRSASDAIGRLSGRVDVEHVLDRLFGEFCIGK